MTKNKKLASMFYEMASIYEMFDVDFKPRAYERAAGSVDGLDQPIENIAAGGQKALEALPGIGPGIAERILEFLKTGRMKDYETLKKQMPADVSGLMQIEGVGPRMVRAFYEGLGIKTLADLKKAVEKQRIRKLPGFGEKTEEMLAAGLKFLEKGRGRFLLGEVKPYIDQVLAHIAQSKAAKRVEAAGSTARWKATVGDLDVVAETTDPEQLVDDICKIPEVANVLVRRRDGVFVRLKNDMDMDVVAAPSQEFGAALLYFSGEKFHNIELRALAREQGMKLSQFGLFKGTKLVASRTEEEIYSALGLQFIPPELRATADVLKIAKQHKLPKLVEREDIKGDLHVHSDWSEGTSSMKEMVNAAKKLGHAYIAFTDHTKYLAMANGLDEKRLAAQMRAIDKLQKEIGSRFKIFKGAEVNILEDGSLDIDDKTLAKLDIVFAGVHSQMHMTQKDMTGRIVRALENPHVDVLAHPTGRLLGRREGIAFDAKRIFEAAAKTKTALQINGYINRLDLPDELIREAIGYDLLFTTDTDAHDPTHLAFMDYAVHTARAGWASKQDILNTKTAAQLTSFLKK